MNAGNTELWYPFTLINPKKISGSAFPCATSHDVGKILLTSISPITIPSTGDPPNFLNADQHTSTGRNPNAVSVKICVNCKNCCGIASDEVPKKESSASCVRNPRSPMKSPVATMTGMIGTNTSANTRISCCNLFPRFAAAAACSFLDDPSIPSFITSSYTLFTIPVPRIIWYCPAVKKHPFTISIASTFLSSIISLFFTIRRNLVAQCATEMIFSDPPTTSMICCATAL